MARLTVEDCLKNVDNRFQLVIKAAKRARAIEMGAMPKVEWEHDKPTVLALREIAEGIWKSPQVEAISVEETELAPEMQEVVEIAEVMEEPLQESE